MSVRLAGLTATVANVLVLRSLFSYLVADPATALACALVTVLACAAAYRAFGAERIERAAEAFVGGESRPRHRGRVVHYVFVEGCIGAGKTVLLERVGPRLRARGLRLLVVPEPLERWRDVDGHNLLDLFYEDVARWALTFQTHAMSTRVAAVREAIEAEPGDDELVVLCERSVYTDRHVFVEMLHADGKMTGAERAAYVTAFDFYTRFAYPGHEAGVVYLRADAERCERHMRERARTEEAGVPRGYLERLVARHDEAVPTRWNGSTLTLDVATLGDVPRDAAAADRCTETLFDFITKECGNRVLVNTPPPLPPPHE